MVVYHYLSYICKNHLWTPKAKAEDLPFCLNIYPFSYLVFARSVNSRLPRRMRRFVQMIAARRCGKHRLSAKYEYKTQIIQRCDSLSRVSSVAIRLSSSEILQVFNFNHGRIKRGDRDPDPPPCKITSYIGFYREWAIGPPPPTNSWTPTENVGSPLEPRKMIVFYESNRLSSVK